MVEKEKIKISVKPSPFKKIKIVLAGIMIFAEIIAVVGSLIQGATVGAVALFFFIIITFDYIRVLRKQPQSERWYEVDEIEVE